LPIDMRHWHPTLQAKGIVVAHAEVLDILRVERLEDRVYYLGRRVSAAWPSMNRVPAKIATGCEGH
jgi:hypothetical protein